MTTQLYRGSSNNGVGTILTEAAVEACEARAKFWQEHDTYVGTEKLLAQQIAGTFTFVKAEYYDYHYRGFATGTYDDLNEWVKGSPYEISYQKGVSNYVPFSNQHNWDELEAVRSREEVAEAFGLDLATLREFPPVPARPTPFERPTYNHDYAEAFTPPAV